MRSYQHAFRADGSADLREHIALTASPGPSYVGRGFDDRDDAQAAGRLRPELEGAAA